MPSATNMLLSLASLLRGDLGLPLPYERPFSVADAPYHGPRVAHAETKGRRKPTRRERKARQ